MPRLCTFFASSDAERQKMYKVGATIDIVFISIVNATFKRGLMKRKTTFFWLIRINLLFSTPFPSGMLVHSVDKSFTQHPEYNWDSGSDFYGNSPDVSSILRNQPSSSPNDSPDFSLYSLPTSQSPQPLGDDSSFSILQPVSFENTKKIEPNSQEIAQDLIRTPGGADAAPTTNAPRTILINFNNVSIIEYIRFISRISNKNFVFDENDLQFNVTIISEEPTTIENIITALLQELRIHDLNMIEEGDNLIIHKNPKVNSISKVVVGDPLTPDSRNNELVTQVFRLNTLDPEKAALVLRPLVSETALIEVIKDSNHLIVTDLVTNVNKISQLLKSIDAPNSGLVIGQYVSRLTAIDALVPIAQKIMEPISQDQPLNFVTHTATNSIFIVSTPFLVERTISIMQYLDQDQGETRILDMNDLRLGKTNIVPRQGAPLPGTSAGGSQILRTPSGQWTPGNEGNWIFKPQPGTTTPQESNPLLPPQGRWSQDADGNWIFNHGAAGEPGSLQPKGRWVRDKDGHWTYELDAGENFNPEKLSRQFQGRPGLPGGVEKKAKFYIKKLLYRRGESLERVLRQIADSLQQNERGNEDLIATLRSVQWLEPSNSFIFSGTPDAIAKASELVTELDKPMRQVLIEMLILETTITDSLDYGVAYGTRFGGGNISGAQAFIAGQSPITGALSTTGLNSLGQVIQSTTALPFVPNGTNVANGSGFNLGVIGQKITHCGKEFGSIGGLVNALHDRSRDKVIMNPKLLSEDGAPAEIFVGINTPFRTQSISNDFGSVITSNFEYRDVGTTFKMTPYIGNGNIITLDIAEEVSTVVAGLITNANSANTSPGPTTRTSRTTTRVHIPDGYFLIISGMLQDQETRDRAQVPCLGGIPLLGAGFSNKTNHDEKRNLLLFIRPKIIDTEDEIQNITKHQQDIFEIKQCYKNTLEYETVEALDLFNIKKTLHPEDEYDCDCN